MMNRTLHRIVRALLVTLFFFFLVNLIAFGVGLLQTETANDWSFRFKYGTFFIDGEAQGLVIGTAKATGFLVLMFMLAYFRELKKDRKNPVPANVT